MIKNVSYELLRGIAYLKVRHPNSLIYTFWIPIILTATSLIFIEIIPKSPQLIGNNSFFSGILTVISTLPGFYFAALAAIATFTNENIDKEMPSPTPEIKILVKGRYIINKLTRRQFLSYLFSYLVTLSLIVCFSIVALNGYVDTISDIKSHIISIKHGEIYWGSIKLLILFPIFFAISSMISVTLQGIFFLTERIHQP